MKGRALLLILVCMLLITAVTAGATAVDSNDKKEKIFTPYAISSFGGKADVLPDDNGNDDDEPVSDPKPDLLPDFAPFFIISVCLFLSLYSIWYKSRREKPLKL